MRHRRARPKSVRFADLNDLALSPPWHDEPEPPARRIPSSRPLRRDGWDIVGPPVASSEHAQTTAARLNGGRPGGALPVEPSLDGPALLLPAPSPTITSGGSRGPGAPAAAPRVSPDASSPGASGDLNLPAAV